MFTVAVAGVSDVHVAMLVRFCVVPSVYVPVAVNCCVVPNAIDGLCGLIAIDTSAAAVTVTVVDPVTEPDVAVIVAVPSPSLLANPALAGSLLIVAVPGVSDDHVTVPVMFCTLPSVYVPVAVKCCVVPNASTGIAGVTAIDTSTAGVIVTIVEPLIAPELAVTAVLPKATLVTNPCPVTVATVPSPVLQFTVFVTSIVLPSL